MVFDAKSQRELLLIKRSGFLTAWVLVLIVSVALEVNPEIWLISLIPMLILLALAAWGTHMYLKFDAAILQQSVKEFILITVYNSVISIGIFYVLMVLRLTERASFGWGYAFIPYWYATGVAAFFLGFIAKGLLAKGEDGIRLFVMSGLWIVAFIVSSIFHVTKLETGFPSVICAAWSPVFFTGIIGLVWLAKVRVERKRKGIKVEILTYEFLWTIGAFVTYILTILKLMIFTTVAGVIGFIVVLKVSAIWIILQERDYAKFKKDGYEYIEN